MGVAASGATLEIQLVADVARLQRDMRDMQAVVGSATTNAGKSFAGMSATTVNSAAQMAAAAQASARAATGMASGLTHVGASAANARIVTLEMFHVTKNLTEQLATGVNPARALTSEIGRIATAVQYSGGSIGGLIKQFGEWVGIIKVTRDAELAEAAAQASGAAAAIKSRAERAASTLLARNAEVALAQAALAAATSDDAVAVAQSRLVKAYRGVEVAAGQTAIANDALAAANVEVAATAEAAAAAEATALAPFAAVVLAIGAVVAALGSVVLATIKYEEAQKRLLATSIGLGAAAGLTARQLEAAGEAGAKWSGESISQSTKAAEAFASSGVQSQEVIAQLSGSIQTYAELTGVKFADAQKALAEAMKDPVKGASELHDQLGILDGDQIQQIERLSELGDKNQAVAILVAAYTQRIGEANDAGIGATSTWGTMTTALSNLWHWLGEANNALLDHVALLGDMRRAAAAAAEKEQNLIQLQVKLNNMSKGGFDLFKATPEGKAASELDELHGSMQKLQDALIADTALHGANSDAVKRDRQALDDYSHAINTYLTPVQKKLAADALDVKLAAAKHAHNQQLVKDLTTQKALLEEAGKIESAADARALAAGKGDAAAAGVFQPKAKGDHGLAEALALLDAQIKGEYRLAAAYQVSDQAAIEAEAQQKAEEAAIRHKGETAIFYEKEIALAVAKGLANGAKVTADLRYEADARAAVNNQVAAGLIPASQAGKELELEGKLRELSALAAKAEGEKKQELVEQMRLLTKANDDNNAAIASGIALQEISSRSDALDKLQLEVNLIGESNRVRAVRLAQLEAEQFIRNNQIKNSADDPTLVERTTQVYIDQANAAATLAEAQNAYNSSLSYAADLLSLINDRAQLAGQTLSDAFGSVGAGIGQAISALTNYAAVQAKVDQDHLAAIKAAGNNAAELARQEALYAAKSANAQMAAIGGVIGGLKGLFKEHSAGYKAMEAVEKAFAIAQLIRTIATIAPKIAAGAATMFSQLGVFAFPAVAAMIALMAGLGFGGGGSSVQPPSAADLQKAQGTGTVLGDPSAKSASIVNSLELMAKNSTKGLDYSSAMVTSLRKIESGIGNLTAAIARELQLSGGAFDSSALGLGTTTKGLSGAIVGGLFGIVGILGGIGKLIFNTKKTVTLIDQGIQITGASIQQIIDSGIQGLAYQTVQINKTSKFLGITVGSSSSTKDVTGALDPEISRQFQLIIGNIYNSVVDAAKVLGLDVAAALATFQVEIGKISFKDLKGDEITKALEAVFSKIGDQMAGFAVAGLEQFQKAGEGLFETLMRLAKDYLTVDAALKSIGLTFGSVGVASVAARESLIDLMGGLDQFVSQINFYYDHFLSAAEQTSFLQSQIDATFGQLGIAEPTTIDAFKSLVSGLDLTTAAGQATFAALMAIAPAFYTVATAAQQAADAAAAAAAQLLKQQQDLQVQLLKAQGNDAAATALSRSIALAALDPSLQALQKQVWAAQDAAAAAATALAIKNSRDQIQLQLLEAQGKATEALALQRKIELAGLDPTLRGLQQQVYAAQDLAKAKDNLLTAYKAESQTLQDTADKFHKFADDLRAFRDSLFSTSTGPASYNQALINLMKQSGLASSGNEDALGGGLQDAAQKFLDIATANAGSLQDVARARALVARQLDQAIGGADAKASIAEMQLDQMKDQVGKLVDINDSVLTVAQAIQQLNALLVPVSASSPAAQAPSHTRHPPAPTTVAHQTRVERHLEDIKAAVTQGALSTNKSARILDRATRGGDSLVITTDADTPVQTQVVP